MDKENRVTQNFLCGIEKCHRFPDFVSGVVHGSASELSRDGSGMGAGAGLGLRRGGGEPPTL